MALRLSSARRQSSAVLEEARQRLRQRFLKRWPAAAANAAVPTTCWPAATAKAVSSVSVAPEAIEDCHLQAARSRLRSRYLEKWPAADRISIKVDTTRMESWSGSPYLEEARQRIRMRASARFGAKSKGSELPTPATQPQSMAASFPGATGSPFLGRIPVPSQIPQGRGPSMLRAVSTTVASTMPLSGLPVHSLERHRAVSLIGAPIADGQPLGGVDFAPDAFRQAGLQRIVERMNFIFEDAGDVGVLAQRPTEQQSHLVKNSTMIGQKVGELHKRAKVEAAKGNFVLTVGGDHSIASGSITGIHAKNPDLSVIWVDAHADCNTPESSESKNYHGMPLAHVLGWFQTPLPGFEWCDQHLRDCGPLPESRVALVGIRDLDSQERALVKQSGLHVFTMSDIDCFGIGQVMEMALACVDNTGKRPLHLSFDIDACDPAVAPGTGTRARGGLSYREAHYICERVSETERLISMDLVEVNPSLDEAQSSPPLHGDDPDINGTPTVSLGIELVASALGKHIL